MERCISCTNCGKFELERNSAKHDCELAAMGKPDIKRHYDAMKSVYEYIKQEKQKRQNTVSWHDNWYEA